MIQIKDKLKMSASSHAIETEDMDIPLANSIRKLIDNLPPISPKCCIYRVPRKLRRVNEKAYTPQLVSVGPYHHGKKELQVMEEHKLRFLREFINRGGVSLEKIISVIKEWEEQIRNCYVENINLEIDEFVKIILVDSCFILEAIWRDTADDLEEQTDYLFKPELIDDVRQDMILLENQLPFFVLERLFSLGFTNPGDQSFLELSIRYFFDLMLNMDVDETIKSVMDHIASGFEVQHFVDLMRICHLPSDINSFQASSGDFMNIPKAEELQEAGINFKRASSNCPLEIQYTTGLLEIPKIKVEDYSECTLVNLAALEHCHYPYNSYITEYIAFMDELIETSKDVDLLIHDGIIENWLSDSSAVAALYSKVAMETTLFNAKTNFYTISENLNAYCNVPCNRWKANLKRDYFRTPCLGASTFAAIILLVLTLIQTICSVISAGN